MLKQIIISFLLIFYVFPGFAQGKLNPYKYIIIPKRYEFFKEEDKYRLNALTKFLFEKQGFKTVWEGEQYPDDLRDDPCKGLRVDLKNNSNMFTSKLVINLVDCRNQVVFESSEGRSKEKEYQKSFQEALRDAFISVQQEEYRYEPKSESTKSVVAAAEAEEKVEQRISVQKPVEEKKEKYILIPAENVKDQVLAAKSKSENVARSFRGEKISFFLIFQGDEYAMYINESKDPNYKKGEKIGTLQKTSLPNVFRVNWKTAAGTYEDSTAYFDESGNFKIDVKENGVIKVKEFKVEK